MEIAQDILCSMQDMKKLSEYEHVILVKKLRCACHAQIAEEIVFCMEQNIHRLTE
jgi:hypothetical protein